MDDGSDLHNLDLYGPKDSTEALPVVVLIHGGGYISCDKFIDSPHMTISIRMQIIAGITIYINWIMPRALSESCRRYSVRCAG